MAVSIRLVFEDNWRSIGPEMRRHAAQVVAKTARDIQAESQSNAPVDTGYLKNSINAEEISDLTWEITVGAEYGPHVEYGTRLAPAQPFFTPAVENHRQAFLDALRRIAR